MWYVQGEGERDGIDGRDGGEDGASRYFYSGPHLLDFFGGFAS